MSEAVSAGVIPHPTLLMYHPTSCLRQTLIYDAINLSWWAVSMLFISNILPCSDVNPPPPPQCVEDLQGRLLILKLRYLPEPLLARMCKVPS